MISSLRIHRCFTTDREKATAEAECRVEAELRGTLLCFYTANSFKLVARTKRERRKRAEDGGNIRGTHLRGGGGTKDAGWSEGRRASMAEAERDKQALAIHNCTGFCHRDFKPQNSPVLHNRRGEGHGRGGAQGLEQREAGRRASMAKAELGGTLLCFYTANSFKIVVVQSSVLTDMFKSSYEAITKGNDMWNQLSVPAAKLYSWDPSSTYIHEPPYE